MNSGTSVPEDFVGDGKYNGDGGAALQRLWELAKWREIRGCPGRYVSSEKSIRSLAPQEVLQRLRLPRDSGGNSGGGSSTSVAATHHMVQEFQIPGKDRIAVACLEGGGGLLTYVKVERPVVSKLPRTAVAPLIIDASDQNQDPGVVFVHTLNTESGLLRKVEALGLGGSVLPQVMTAIAPAGVLLPSNRPLSTSSARGVIFYALLVVLGYLTPAEKNAAATVLVVWSKRLVRDRLRQ